MKTNFVGAEVAPVPDHVLTIGANANDTVTQAAGIATADSCLTGLTVPAMGSIVVYYSPYSTVTFGAATLRVTTKN